MEFKGSHFEKKLLIDIRFADEISFGPSETRKMELNQIIIGSGEVSASFKFHQMNAHSIILNCAKLHGKLEIDDVEVANKSLIFSCGSGITACIVLLASELCLQNETAVYDGSWTEWTQLESK